MESEDLFEEIEESVNTHIPTCSVEIEVEDSKEVDITGAITNERDENNAIEEATEAATESTEKAPSNVKQSAQVKLAQLPLARVRCLMKLDPDLHFASNEAIFVVTRATELFIESLAREAFSYTAKAKKKTLQKRDVDTAAESVDSLTFLDGIVL